MINKIIHKISQFPAKLTYEIKHIFTPSQYRILILGDSHCRVFDYIRNKDLYPKFYFKVVKVKGATARGLINPNSKTNAIKIFQKAITQQFNFRQCKYILIQLGEVDCGYLIWYRVQKYQESVEKQFNQSLDAYFSFINWLIPRTNATIILSSVIPPTIQDNHMMGEVANQRKEVNISQIERTQLTLKYNEQIKHFCKNHEHLIYLEITKDLLNQKTGLVDKKFMNEDPSDHHLSSEKTYSLWIDKLLKIVETK